MDFHLDTLLNLPNVTVFTCYQKEGFKILQLDLLNEKVSCTHCGKKTDDIHQNRPILVRDLSICGQSVYLNEQLSAEQVQNIFSRIASSKKKTGHCQKE
jgi:transposase